MHWIQGKKSHEDGQPIIKVKVVPFMTTDLSKSKVTN